jgi:uncharacterized protein
MLPFTKAKPYRTLTDFYHEQFHTKVFKIALNGDFNCPNRDGSISDQGCIFCSEKGSGDFAGDKEEPLLTQFETIRSMMNLKWPEGKMIAYFQANTNTYAPIEKLKSLYETALLLDKDIVGLSIATRPDAIANETLDYLADLNHRTFLTVELGLQTIHQKTADWMNRGYALDVFEDTVSKLRKKHIRTVVHVINGLKSESKAMMLDTIRYLSKLDIQGIKIHMLCILKNTPLETEFKNQPFPILSLTEYVDIVSDQIELLRPDIVLERLTGDAPKALLIAPEWTLKKFVVTNGIDKELRRRKSWQGSEFSL